MQLVGSLHRHRTLQQDTIEVSDLRHGIVAVCLVQQAALIPDDEVARQPTMSILQRFLSTVREKFRQ
jgi:hypothetical protein